MTYVIKFYNTGSKIWHYDTSVSKLFEEASGPLIPEFGSNDDELCLTFNTATKAYSPKNCASLSNSFCQVPVDGLIFTAVTNSTSKCVPKEKYNLIGESSAIFFAGFYGTFIIKKIGSIGHGPWAIFENNFDLQEQKIVASIVSDYLFQRTEILNVIGIHLIECNNPETNALIQEYLKISNVSDKVTL